MADKKITDLQLISSIQDDLNIAGDNTLQTYRFTAGMFRTYSRKNSVVAKNAAYTAVATDDTIKVDTSGGAWTLGLEGSPPAGRRLKVIKTSSDFTALTIGTVTSINTIGETVELEYDGATWLIVYRYIPSNFVAYTPTVTAFGTVVSNNFYWKREGDSIKIRGRFNCGTPSGATASIGLPTGLAIDSTKINATHNSILGILLRASAANQNFPLAGNGPMAVTCDAGVSTTAVFISQNMDNSQAFYLNVGNNIANASDVIMADFSVPIAGWNG